MATVDAYNNVFEVLHHEPARYTGLGASGANAVDTAGFESVTFIIACGTIGPTGEVTAVLKESDNNTTFTEVVNSDLIVNMLGSSYASGMTASFGNNVFRIGYLGDSRYLRCDMRQATTNNS